MDGGTVLVCGSASTFDTDFRDAQTYFPHAPVIAVNAAAGLAAAEHLFSLHPEKMEQWRSWQQDKFSTDPHLHGGVEKPDTIVEHFWPEANGHGTSGWSAAKLARLWGYDMIVLCGVPLTATNYARRGPAKAFMKPHVLEHYRGYVESDKDLHPFVRSMSGWTRDLLGEP